MDKEIGLTTVQLIQSTLPTQSEFDEGEEFSFDRLHEWLTSQVAYLIDHDFKKLVESLYRIDVSENTVSNIMNGAPEELASQLASAILDRQLKKITSTSPCILFGFLPFSVADPK